MNIFLEMWGVSRLKIASLEELPDKDRIIEKAILVDRQHLFGLDPDHYLGMVHYFQLPMFGERSGLLARFFIKRVGKDELTLEFVDLRVP